ncbi:MAG: hypothetical protein ABI542_11590 [Gemmatimonadota bacterium]
MRLIALIPACVVLAACEAKAPPPPPPPPPPPTIADFAGEWHGTNVLQGVADPVPSTMQGSAAGTDWYLSLAGRDSIPLTMTMHGDSLIALSDRYESILRKGVIVQVRTASVLTEGGMAGKLVATYDSPAGQELVTGTINAVRAAGTP